MMGHSTKKIIREGEITMCRKYITLLIIISLIGIIGCKSELKISGNVKLENDEKGISGLKFDLEIDQNGQKVRIPGKTDSNGRFEIPIQRSIIPNIKKGKKATVFLPNKFCYPYEIPVDLSEKSLEIKIKIRTYGAGVEGKVVDRKEKKPIPDADVSLVVIEGEMRGGSRTTKTELAGMFSFNCITCEKVKFRITHPYFVDKETREVSLFPGEIKYIPEEDCELERIIKVFPPDITGRDEQPSTTEITPPPQ